MADQPGAAPPFKDYFSDHAADYAAVRPHYPAGLFRALAALTAGHARAWDCACGSGQASVALAAHYRDVQATDASAPQVAVARPHRRVHYGVAPAGASGLPDCSVDLVTVAQALHWFDLPNFYAEVDRVLKPGGVLAVWAYDLHAIDDPACNDAFHVFHDAVIERWWPPERALVRNHYGDVALPFAALPAPRYAMRARWALARMLGYVASWSATRRLKTSLGYDPVPRLQALLSPLWGPPQTLRTISWPLIVRIARKPAMATPGRTTTAR